MEYLNAVKDWLGFLGPAGPWILAIVILVIGFFASKLIAKLVKASLEKATFDDKLAKLLGKDCEGCEKGISTFVFYLLMLFLVVFALNVADESEAVEPLQKIIDQVFGFIPNLLGALLIGAVAWVLATLAKNILQAVLSASGVDERLGLGEKKPITNTVGMVAFFGVILLLLPSVLQKLELGATSEPINDIVRQITGYVPFLLSAIIVLFIGYHVASIVQKVLSNVLSTIGVDTLPSKLGYSGGDSIGGKPLSLIVSYIAMATVLVIFGAEAIKAMQLEFISELSDGFVDGYFKILAAVIIFFIALYVANIVGQLIEPKSQFWANFARTAILIFFGAVALQKANISPLTNDIFQTSITAIIIAAAFALGVGGAIALGLGGREKAKDLLSKWKG